MSASAKLRALIEEAAWEGGQGGGHDATETIEDALSLIADVVEAAEKSQNTLLLRSEPAGVEMVGWRVEDAQALTRALTALREHLGEKA